MHTNMASLLIITLIVTLITITAGICPYVANYYYQYNMLSDAVVTGATFIDECRVKSNEINGITYDSEKLVCTSNDEVYINKYIGTTCSESPGFTAKVGPVPASATHLSHRRAEYAFSCDQSSGCTNYFIWTPSNTSYMQYMRRQIPSTCPDHSNDNFVDYLPGDMTDICVDTTVGNLSVPDTSRIAKCNATGVYHYEYVGTSQCIGTPQSIVALPINGCGTGPLTNIYGKMIYCNGVNYNGGPDTTTTTTHSPTQMTATPTNQPTVNTQVPTKMPSNSPTRMTSIPTKIPTNTPTEMTDMPSIAPTENTYAPTGSPEDIGRGNGSEMLSCTLWMILVLMCFVI